MKNKKNDVIVTTFIDANVKKGWKLFAVLHDMTMAQLIEISVNTFINDNVDSDTNDNVDSGTI